MREEPVNWGDVLRAAEILKGVVHRTPVMSARTLNELCHNEVFLKCEGFQRAGSFKFRGAYYAMSRLSPEQRHQGVITFSSGNHAQAVALSGRILKIPTVIVMPEDAPQVKIAATRSYGAEIVFYNPEASRREELAHALMRERGLTLIPPFDHPDVIAGGGTAAQELFEDVGPLDYLFVPCGGGGLLSGSALVAKALVPQCRVYGVEPEAHDDGRRSFESGALQRLAQLPQTLADGAARMYSLGELTFSLIRRYVDGMLTASDGDLVRTMRFLWERLKIIVEPTGVLGLAPLLGGRLEIRGKRVGVILSGGNVDLQRACELFARSH